MRVALAAGPDAGHFLPVMSVATGLRDRGHETLVLTSDAWRDDIVSDGVEFETLPLLAPTTGDEDIGYRIWQRAADMAVPLAETLRGWAPDLIVSDVLTAAGGFAAGLLGLPWVEVSPHHMIDPSPAVPPVGLGRAPSRLPWHRWYDAHIRSKQSESLRAGARVRGEARQRIGLDPRGGRPGARLLATLPDLEHPRPDWPPATYVVGPLDWEPQSWPVLAPPAGNAPLVLVSDSTATSVDLSLSETAVAALSGRGLRVVITTGSPPAGLPEGMIAGRGRHSVLLSDAAVVVGFGGHGLVSKSLAAGVPLVLVPLQGDQRETAGRVEHLGVGRSVPASKLAPERLRAAVTEVLDDPGFEARAAEVARGAARGGPARAASVIENLAATPHPSGSVSPVAG